MKRIKMLEKIKIDLKMRYVDIVDLNRIKD
jgi:hypothetical protein